MAEYKYKERLWQSINIMAVKVNTTISDHLFQFLIVPNILSDSPSNKSNIYETGCSNFDQENFILDYFYNDWDKTLKIEEQNNDYSTEIF